MTDPQPEPTPDPEPQPDPNAWPPGRPIVIASTLRWVAEMWLMDHPGEKIEQAWDDLSPLLSDAITEAFDALSDPEPGS